MSRAQRASLVRFFQFFSGELSNALEHEQTLAAVGHLASDQALVNQLVESGRTIPGERVRDDSVNVAPAEPADKHRQAPKQGALGRAEQLVAPGDHVMQRLVPASDVAAAIAQRGLSLLQFTLELIGRGHSCPRRGQLNREGKAVEEPDNFGNRRRVPLVEREVGVGAARPVGRTRTPHRAARDRSRSMTPSSAGRPRGGTA